MLDDRPISLFPQTPGVTPIWVIKHLPPWAYTKYLSGVAVWQWIALPVVFALSMLGGYVFVAIFARLLTPLARRTSTTWDDELIVAQRGPAALFFGTMLFWSVEPVLALRRAASARVGDVVDVLLVVSVFWGLIKLLDVLGKRVALRIAKTNEARGRSGGLSLVAISTKAAKVLLVIFGFILVLGQVGIEVKGIITGLGIGGIAVALASQKTLENLFGSFTLGVDRPLHIGDYVKVDDLVGTVEQIGLRSTRIRTLDRTLVTMPNGRLSEMRIENYGERDRLRLHAEIGILYSTPTKVIRQIVQEMRSYLAERPDAHPHDIRVHLVSFADSALILEVMVWCEQTGWLEFLSWREETMLGLMEIVEKNGSSIAFPTRTIHVEPSGAALSPAARAAVD